MLRIALLLSIAGPLHAVALAGQPAAESIQDLGIPVRSVNWARLHLATDAEQRPCVLASMGQDAAGLFVLKIDPASGRNQQFTTRVASANFPTATYMSRSGTLYIGAAYAGHLLSFDPHTDQLRDLGQINAGAATFPCRIDEDSQGRLWIGSYPTADLTCYDPANGEFTHFGRMDPVDMYNYPWVSAADKVACVIRMTKPHVALLDPVTKTRTTIGPVTTKGKGTLDVQRGRDGQLYIVSSVGSFRIDGTEARPVDKVPPALPTPLLTDGSAVRFADGTEQIYRRLEIRQANGTSREVPLTYDASGNNIFCLHAGPDGCVYGSSYLPEHFFRYDPRTGELVDFGRCSSSSGEAYSMANWGGNIYIASYPAARVSVYDPKRPYRYGVGATANPRELGRIDDISYRPRSALAGPLDRIWFASIPDYGRWGGPLTWLDPKTHEKKAYYRVVGDASCYTLAHLPTLHALAIGTSIAGGSGTKPRVRQAQLVLWDYAAEKILWQGTLDRPVVTFNGLQTTEDGQLVGTARVSSRETVLFAFDATARRFLKTAPVPAGHALDLGLQLQQDGPLIGYSSACIYSVDPQTLGTRAIVRPAGGISVPGPVIAGRAYFARGCHLYAVEL